MAKDPKKFANKYKLKKTAPKGVDPEKYDRCVEQVKRKGKAKNAYAVCASSLQKGCECAKCAERTKFMRSYKMKKSYDFKDQQVMLASDDVAIAETSAFPPLVDYINNCVNVSGNDITKVNMAKGTLTVVKKAEGLYAGFFQDGEGQIVEQFENMTIPMIAKNLEVKNLYDRPMPVPEEPKLDESDARHIAAQEAHQALMVHNDIYHRGQQPGEPIKGDGEYVRIRYGNFELEIKKSMQDFIKSFKNDQPTKSDIKKALSTWRRNSKTANQFRTDFDAAQALISDWDQYGEDFNQVLFAMKMKHEK